MFLSNFKTCNRLSTQFFTSRAYLNVHKSPRTSNFAAVPARNFVNLSQLKKITFLTRRAELVKTLRQCSNKSEKAQKLKRSDVQRLLSLAKSEKLVLAAAIGCLVISSSITIAVPYALGRILDIIFSKTAHSVMIENLKDFCLVRPANKKEMKRNS